MAPGSGRCAVTIPEDSIHVSGRGDHEGSVGTIAEAMKRMPGGGTILLHDSLYQESLIVTGRFAIRPVGETRPVLRGTTTSTLELYGGSLFLENLQVEGTSYVPDGGHAVYVVTAGHVEAHHCTFQANDAAAVTAGGRQTTVRLENCLIAGTGKAGIHISRYASAEIENVIVTGAGLAGVEVTDNAQVTLMGCTVQKCLQDGAIARDPGTILLARNCQFLENGHSGMAAFASAIIEASGCTFRDNRQLGVLAADGGYASLLGNTFHRQWRGAALALNQGLLIDRTGNRYRVL